MTVAFIEIDWPDAGGPAEPPPPAPAEEYRARLELARGAMERERLSHLAVYADREHFGTLAWLTGFDPRFEEALLLIGAMAKPLVLVGNECVGYAPVSPLIRDGSLRLERLPLFSLPDQPQPPARSLEAIVRDEGIDAHSRVGCAGWKTYSAPHQTDIPSYLADILRFAAGWENVVNATGLFLDSRDGLRMEASPHEIALFEYAGVQASEGMKRVLSAAREGARDFDLLEQARYNGLPLGCHMTLKCGANRLSLASARGERVVRGGRLSCGISYWGANCCRAGWAVEEDRELPVEARDYREAFAAPYFEAMAAWFGELRLGATGGALHRAIHSRLAPERFGIFLNAGHLIHREEWLASPVWDGSDVPLRSGMVMQSDVIPSSAAYYTARMEDGYALAGPELRARLDPALLERCDARRRFMRTVLGLPVSDDVLPLSNAAGLMPVFLLRPGYVPAVRYSG